MAYFSLSNYNWLFSLQTIQEGNTKRKKDNSPPHFPFPSIFLLTSIKFKGNWCKKWYFTFYCVSSFSAFIISLLAFMWYFSIENCIFHVYIIYGYLILHSKFYVNKCKLKKKIRILVVWFNYEQGTWVILMIRFQMFHGSSLIRNGSGLPTWYYSEHYNKLDTSK